MYTNLKLFVLIIFISHSSLVFCRREKSGRHGKKGRHFRSERDLSREKEEELNAIDKKMRMFLTDYKAFKKNHLALLPSPFNNEGWKMNLSYQIGIPRSIAYGDPNNQYFTQKRVNNKACNRKCYKPKCEVECAGNQGYAACNAKSCHSNSDGPSSSSVCTGQLCQSTCYKESCLAACEGNICLGKCKGTECNAMSHGSTSQASCHLSNCTAQSHGSDTEAKCEGYGCRSFCRGKHCVARCNGEKCFSMCQGLQCDSSCNGKSCENTIQDTENADDIPERKEISPHVENDRVTTGDYEGQDSLKANIFEPINENEYDEHKRNKERPQNSKIILHYTGGDIHQNSIELSEDDDNSENVRLKYELGIKLTPFIVDFIKKALEEIRNHPSHLQFRSSLDDGEIIIKNFTSKDIKQLKKGQVIEAITKGRSRKNKLRNDNKHTELQQRNKEEKQTRRNDTLKNGSRKHNHKKDLTSDTRKEDLENKGLANTMNINLAKSPMKVEFKNLRRGQSDLNGNQTNFFTNPSNDYVIKINI